MPALTAHLVDNSGGALTSGATVNLSAGGSTGGITRYSAATVTLDTSLNAVNDAPNVVGGAAVTLAAINEDNTNPPGDTVTNLFASHFSDADDNVGVPSVDNFSGIAITSNAATAEGVWQYFSGGVWTTLPAVAANNAFLVAAADSLRFVPALEFQRSRAIIDRASGRGRQRRQRGRHWHHRRFDHDRRPDSLQRILTLGQAINSSTTLRATSPVRCRR